MYQITLGIDGMMCGMCESHINDAVRNACILAFFFSFRA